MAATVTVVDVTVVMETEVVMGDVIRRIFAVLHRIGTVVNPPAEVQQRIDMPMRINSQIFKMDKIKIDGIKKNKFRMANQK